jgi:DNA polymerase III subunit gamma/tau
MYMATLYRTYRPQTFAEVEGQQVIVKTLQQAVAGQEAAHAYLFCGSRGVGKTTLARILAKALNCLEPKNGECCGKCAHCVSIADGSFVDLVEIDAASHTGVDNVRELIEHVRFQPALGKFKVVIIDEVHMLSKGAFNALLKTLEEPPDHVVFILATTDLHKVPQTIVSRTQSFTFLRCTPAEITTRLIFVAEQEHRGLSEEVRALIAERSDGSMRDALSLLGKVWALGDSATLAEVQVLLGVIDVGTIQNFLRAIGSGTLDQIPALLNEVSSRGAGLSNFTKEILEYVRVLLQAKLSGAWPDLAWPEAAKQMAQTQAAELKNADIVLWIRTFLRVYKEQQGAPLADLPLLVAAVELGERYKTVVPASPIRATQPEPVRTLMRSEVPTPTVGLVTASEVTNKDPITLEEVITAWPQVLEILRGLNGPLATLVKNCPVREVVDNSIVLEVKYLFHKENLESKKNYQVIVQAIQQATTKAVRVVVHVVKAQVAVATEDTVQAAIQVFGGELIS